MSETKHTPGPWVDVEEDESGYPIISGYDNTNIAQILCPLSKSKRKHIGELLEEVTANKNLIKAAPDMLAALNFCNDEFKSETPRLNLIVTRLRAAIAKAEGGAE